MFEPLTLAHTSATLTDDQWDAVKDFFDCRRKRKHTIRGIINAILHVIDNDTHWRMLPRQFAPWQTVYYYYDKWKKDGTWQRVLERLPDDIRQKAMASAYASPYPNIDVHVIKTHVQPEKAQIHSISVNHDASSDEAEASKEQRPYTWILQDFLTPEEESSRNQAA